MDFKEKQVLITGASSGIGEALVNAFVNRGAKAIISGRNLAELNRVKDACSQPNQVEVLVLDLANYNSLAQAVQNFLGNDRKIDILINNAGQFIPGSVYNEKDGTLEKMIGINLYAAYHLTRALLPGMMARRSGHIFNISSIAAEIAMGSNIMYCASKAALDNMTKSLARALAPRIRVVSVSPGLVDTEFVKSLDQAWRDEQAARAPLRRLVTPQEVAAAVAAVITNFTCTTGSVVTLDGGRTLG